MKPHDHTDFDVNCTVCLEKSPWLVVGTGQWAYHVHSGHQTEEEANGAALILAKHNHDKEFYVICIKRKVKFCDIKWTEISR